MFGKNPQQQQIEEMRRDREYQAAMSGVGYENRRNEIKQYVEELINMDQNEIPNELSRLFQTLFSKDFALTNLEENLIIKAMAQLDALIFRMMINHPHEESIWQGEIREMYFGDRREALNDDWMEKFEQIKMWFEARINRARNGNERNALTKETRVTKVEGKDKKQGVMGKLFG